MIGQAFDMLEVKLALGQKFPRFINNKEQFDVPAAISSGVIKLGIEILLNEKYTAILKNEDYFAGSSGSYGGIKVEGAGRLHILYTYNSTACEKIFWFEGNKLY